MKKNHKTSTVKGSKYKHLLVAKLTSSIYHVFFKSLRIEM